MNNILLKHLKSIITAITHGDYAKGKTLDHLAESTELEQEEREVIESLGLMSIKLEAREFALEEAVKNLETQNTNLLLEKRKNAFFSTIFVSLFLSVSLYVFLIFLLHRLSYQHEDSARFVEVIFLIVCIIIIWKSKFPFSAFGVTLKGTVDSIRLMLPSTVAICIALVALKGFFIMAGIFNHEDEFFIWRNFDIQFAIYLPVAIVQEFLARGVIQTALVSVLAGKRAPFWAILTASVLFGLVHIQLSVSIAFASFVCGLYWGWLYNRRNCLVGVSLSHFLIGNTAYVLGFWDYLHII